MTTDQTKPDVLPAIILGTYIPVLAKPFKEFGNIVPITYYAHDYGKGVVPKRSHYLLCPTL